jgi:hypothetical protein
MSGRRKRALGERMMRSAASGCHREQRAHDAGDLVEPAERDAPPTRASWLDRRLGAEAYPDVAMGADEEHRARKLSDGEVEQPERARVGSRGRMSSRARRGVDRLRTRERRRRRRQGEPRAVASSRRRAPRPVGQIGHHLRDDARVAAEPRAHARGSGRR